MVSVVSYHFLLSPALKLKGKCFFFNILLSSIRNFSSLVTSSIQRYVNVLLPLAATKENLITIIVAFLAESHMDLLG